MHAYIDNANAELSDAKDRIHRITDAANARFKMIESKIAAAVHDANQLSQDEAENHNKNLRGCRTSVLVQCKQKAQRIEDTV
jgi:hypothetical protein